MSTAGVFWSRNLCLSVIMLLCTKFRVNQTINRADIAEKTIFINPLRFLAGCLTRRLNQVLSKPRFFECVCCAVNYGYFCVALFCVILCVLSLGCSC